MINNLIGMANLPLYLVLQVCISKEETLFSLNSLFSN